MSTLAMPARTVQAPTRHGPARVHLRAPADPAGLLVLGHGAGGGVQAPDLAAAGEGALAAGFAVALVEQPYRVAGRRSPPAAPRLDEAWLDVLQGSWRAPFGRRGRLVAGGRSSGARVACRMASETGAAGVLCLAFPLVPPRRRTAASPSGANPLPPSRLPELERPSVPVLVIQGSSDRFGMPPRSRGRTVVQVPGDHSLRSAREPIAAAVRTWLTELTG